MNPSRKPGWAGWAALAYLAFPVYGSLVPFRWQSRDPFDALLAFQALLAGPLQIDSRADFAANLLLALPLALLLQAALGRRLWTAPLVWAACTLLALLLEGSQLFFSGRSPALSDVVGQSLGALLGVLAAGLVPARFWQRTPDAQAGWRRLFALYLIGLALYALMPLDLTVSLSELAAKWREGRMRLLPFQGWAAEPLGALTNAALDLGLWALATWLGARALPQAGHRLPVALVGLAVLLELAQMLVISRTSDSTTVLVALAGVLLGSRVALGARAAGGAAWLRWGVAFALSLGFVLFATWPWETVTNGAALRARLGAQNWVLFGSYVGLGELRLVTNLLRRLFVFVLLALAWRWAWQGPAGGRMRRVLALGLPCVAVALAVELLQLAMPDQVVDLGDVVLALLAATAVALLAPAEAAAPMAPRKPWHRGWLWALPGAALGVSLGVAHLPGLPYNLRELFGGWGGLAAPGILLGLMALPAGAAWLAQRADPERPGAFAELAWQLPLLALGLSLWLLVWAPTESLHDVVGFPTLGMGALLEVGARLFVLLLGFAWVLALGLCSAWPGRRAWHVVLHAVWVLPLWHGVVVWLANTDNLVELMAGGGSVQGTACWLGYAGLLGLSAGWVWRGGALRRSLALLLLPLLGWALLQAGTEPMLLKYGKAFSALQFLLSEDRATYAQGPALFARFLLAHGVLLAGVWAALAWLAALRRWPT